MYCPSMWFESTVTVFVDHLWTHYKKNHRFRNSVSHATTYIKKITCSSCRSSDSAMFVQNNIPSFECLFRRNIYSFTSRLKTSNNMLINAIENCWLSKCIILKPVLVDRLFS